MFCHSRDARFTSANMPMCKRVRIHIGRTLYAINSPSDFIVSGLEVIVIKWLKKMWLKIRLRFAKRVVGIDVGLGPDSSAWCEARFLKGTMYIVRSGVGNPPAEVFKCGRIYSA